MKSNVLLSLLPALVAARGTTNGLCSAVNTSDSPPRNSVFLSQSFCIDQCKGGFAYAVVKETSCWCTNDAPASTVASNKCNFPCPGYPVDACGGQGYFTYILVNEGMVKGTTGATDVSSTADQTETRPGVIQTSGVAQTTSAPATPSTTAAGTTVDQDNGTTTTAPTQTPAGNGTTSGTTPKPTTAGGAQVDVKAPTLVGMVACSLGALLLSY
ncbi:WSC domain-containing protein [Pochonia chlamydosporia 170]|uniref:WSC domain-containing protein n=1 Tax=Pochonia chlamydosporia 170 TaxID=1380566 RepID=A0A179G3U4_METCM|nr:WSC domain-containing protein [Pochonia chlamydosporia 170]OAQ72023.1 WSC domain-containing protein [Pochonia chlamydosporia 170]